MSKVQKFTFKKRPRDTGLAAVGHSWQLVDIKINKHWVGEIIPKSWQQDFYKVQFRVESDDLLNNPAGWRWAMLKFQCETEKEMRDWITQNAELIQTKLKLSPEKEPYDADS